jgi:hypothetical protein
VVSLKDDRQGRGFDLLTRQRADLQGAHLRVNSISQWPFGDMARPLPIKEDLSWWTTWPSIDGLEDQLARLAEQVKIHRRSGSGNARSPIRTRT